MKRIVVTIVLALATVSAVAQTVSVGTINGQCGQSVSVPVSIDSVSGLLSLEFRAAIDPSITSTSVAAGTLTSSFAISSNVVGGQLRVAMASGTPVSGGGTVAMLTFNVASSVSGTIPLAISNVLVNDVTRSGVNGAINVTCPHPPAAPTNVSPANGATNVTRPVTLRWNAATDATQYRLYFGTSAVPGFAANIGGTQADVQTAPGTTYFWYVEAVNASGATAGPTWSFTTEGTFCATPAAPQGVTAPTTTTSGTAFDVTWNAVDGATSYVIEESVDPLFAGATSTIVNTTHATFTKSIANETTFYYRVYARNGSAPCNVDGPYSTSISIRVTMRPPLAANARIFPVVGSIDGSGGSFFRTSIQLHNFTDGTLRGAIRFHAQGASGSDSDPSIAYTIAPGETVSWSDLLPSMNLPHSIGSVDLMPDSDSAPPLSVVRVYNDRGAAGTTGLTFDGLALADALQAGQRGIIVAPIDPTHARLNIGIRTLLDGVTMTVTVRSKHGATLATQHQSYPPTFFTQVTASALTNVNLTGDETILFSVESGSAMVYASSTDNTTQDPSVQIARPR